MVARAPENEGQDEALAFLGEASTHGLAEAPRRIDTHAAAVFLAGENVYKVKKAVRLPFLDYSTLERRLRACEAEIAVNRPFAPDLYLGTVPVTRGPHGLSLGGGGEVVEWTVHLRRFDETRTLDRLAERGPLPAGLVRALAGVVANAHAGAAVRVDANATEALRGVVEESCEELRQAAAILDAGKVDRFAAGLLAAFADQAPLLSRREREGCVRACHGDLHLRNIALIGDRPVLFDAIEFDAAISVIDVLYDLAFLLMDLWVRGQRAEANAVLNRYLWLQPAIEAGLEGLAALPLFLGLRAAVRAKVEAIRHREAGSGEALAGAVRYLDAGLDVLAAAPALVVGVGGLSGTGKSTLAARIAPALGRPPGAVHLRSDVERKRMLGCGELDRLPESAYTPAVTGEVYAALRRQAAIAARAGQAVVVDAMHGAADEREALEVAAGEAGVRFVGLWLKASTQARVTRVAARTDDASDATPDVARRQREEVDPGRPWATLDASGPLDAVASAALDVCALPDS